MTELEKSYDASQVENKIYQKWLDSGYFNPDNLPASHQEPYSIILPPPNVTGTLHVGHALTVTIEDIIVRYQRMKGKKTLWLPGTDHASIATETKFLKENKLNRNDFNDKRQEFVALVNEFALNNQSTILNQLKAMGTSLDWSRLTFTLDEDKQRAVHEAFTRMYEAGLIYSGEYLVNWDLKGQTTVSDEEVIYEPAQGMLYTFKYSADFPIEIATTRPETKLGDVAVAVHPEGKWKKFIGQEFDIQNFAGTKLHITVVGEATVDPEFGTGAVGVTPAHSKEDWDTAKRHNLPTNKQVINEFGKIINTGTKWDGQSFKIAREEIVTWLKDNGLLVKEEAIEHNVAHAQRSGGAIEILPKRHQFFVNVNAPVPGREGKTLKELMREAVADGQIKIVPQHFEKLYFHWIENLHDWNISRQIWYGHKIPAWYKNNEIKVGQDSPGEGWQPIMDTLDTWFSAGMWTFSTLGWPEATPDLKHYHPTSLLETGYDILFFWVAKMILMSEALLADIPFKTVYLHGMVRGAEKKKMSKSTGNVIDPLDMTAKYGTDALRFALVFNTAPGTDIALAEDKVKGMKHFGNKLWNIARFVMTNVESSDFQYQAQTEADKVILEKLDSAIATTTVHIEEFRLHEAAQEIYQFTWHEFADIYLEASKEQLKDPALAENTKKVLLHNLINVLKLLHPFMPFITEHIWQLLEERNLLGKGGILMIAKWPKNIWSHKL